MTKVKQMSLANITNEGRIAFNLSAIMKHAHHEARFALGLCRARREPVATRRATFGRFLAKAWAAAKAEAFMLRRRIAEAVQVRADLAARAAESVALARHYGSADAIRQAITSEHYRDRLDFAAVARLEAALSSIGA